MQKSEQMIIFGGTGDLAKRKLLPALFMSHCDGNVNPEFSIVGVGRENLDDTSYRTMIDKTVRQFLPTDFDQAKWATFLTLLFYKVINATEASDFTRLSTEKKTARVFYLATSPHLFIPICQNLALAGLNKPDSRVVLEKPLGHDLASARTINREVAQFFAEHQIFRIDHYLGKETVQNLMALRFGNVIFEPLWRAPYIRKVQITVAEEVGVGSRGEFYDGDGALRDMVQNHLLQLLCLVAMEPPTSMSPDALRDEKLRVLRALQPYTDETLSQMVIRGQYTNGIETATGQVAPAYLQEKGVPADSQIETYVAMQVAINSWRWAGVPFFLRTGKRLPTRTSEIVVNFAPVPHSMFSGNHSNQFNRLVIRLQPEETVHLHLMAKQPGEGMTLRPVSLNLDFHEAFTTRHADAYERLLLDVIAGRLTLFMRHDELEAAWQWIDPIQIAWRNQKIPPRTYAAGSWGPAAASAMVAKANAEWSEAL